MSLFAFQWVRFSTAIKFFLLFYAICFLQAGISHWIDIVNGGIYPYTNIPFVLNFYLTSLAIIDLVVFIFIFLKPIYGLVLAIIVMASDLLIDSHILYTSNHRLSENWRLQCLLLFGAFVFFSAPILIFKIKNIQKK